MSQVSFTPADVQVLPRNREYAIARSLERDWFDNHPFKTAWFNAMSITFPLGEKFFIDSVRHFADRINDPKLIEDIRGFCGQEGFHRREHQRYNETLCAQRGYDLNYLEGRLEKNIERGKIEAACTNGNWRERRFTSGTTNNCGRATPASIRPVIIPRTN